MQHHIFLSYSRKDSEIMTRLRDSFRSSGLSVWTDEGIEPGTSSWKRSIEAAILNAGCLVCILSPDAASSEWVRAELDFAQLQEIPIFLVLGRGEERRSIPFGFAAAQWIDLREEPFISPKLEQLSRIIYQKLTIGGAEEDKFKHSPKMMILPQPFEWCDIPPGQITLADARDYATAGTIGGLFEVPSFRIAKYPITNSQFQTFIDDREGYNSPNWWQYSTVARAWHSKYPTPQPTTFIGDNLPRTNISWYECVAFCLWFAAKTGQSIALPTETQWQRAAQGDDNRLFPWGNDFQSDYCSCNKRTTTPVDEFPNGASPYQVMDMSGNVWEWCINSWTTGTQSLEGDDIRVLRGGSYYDEPSLLSVRYRSGGFPQDRNFFRGFRIVVNH